MKAKLGFTIIELIMFIVIIGILAGGALTAAVTSLRQSPIARQQTIAMNAAMRCLDFALGQRYLNGYSSISCPSTAVPSYCSVPNGFTISVTTTCKTLYGDPSANYKQITVAVGSAVDPSMSLLASLSLLLANY